MAIDAVYRRNTDVLARHVLDEMLLVPIRGELAALQRIFALNPVAEHLWSQLDGEHNLAAVRDSLVAVFDVEPDRAEADLIEFVEQLRTSDLISGAD